MTEFVLVTLDEPVSSAKQAALNIKEALRSCGDYANDVYADTAGTVVVAVYEATDAEDEITETLNDAGVSCMVQPYEEELPEDATPVQIVL